MANEQPTLPGVTEEQQTFLGISEKEAREYSRLCEREDIEGLKAHLRKKINEWKNMPLNIGIIGEQQPIFEISKDEAKEYNKLYESKGPEALKAHLGKKVTEWKEIPLNIGILGNSGSGKSSFINQIRDLNGDDEGAAAVGVTETTAEPTSYAHPKNELLKFWDLPGVGTPKFPKEGYLEKIGFDKFDFFLIVASERFTENDKWLAEQITQQAKKFFFVRTKIRTEMQNDKQSHPRTHKEEAVLAKIRDDIRINFGNLYVDENLFLVDNHEPKMYDFEKLERRLIEEFPSIKREALVLSLTALSEWMIKEKVKTLRKYIWMSCAAVGAVALNPIVVPAQMGNFDETIIERQIDLYFHQLGFDKESLNRTAEIMSFDPDTLYELVMDCFENLLKLEDIADFAWENSMNASSETEERRPFTVIIDELVSRVRCFHATYKISNLILTKMEELALLVARTTVENSIDQL